jgi:hypothetical protein
MSEESLEFMDIIRAFPSTTRMLAVDRIDSKSARTNAQDEWILSRSEQEDKGEDDSEVAPLIAQTHRILCYVGQ